MDTRVISKDNIPGLLDELRNKYVLFAPQMTTAGDAQFVKVESMFTFDGPVFSLEEIQSFPAQEEVF